MGELQGMVDTQDPAFSTFSGSKIFTQLGKVYICTKNVLFKV
jgi:hypothetical protein